MPRSLLVGSVTALAFALRAEAQPTTAKPTDPPPCCAITSIDSRHAIVTAEEASTGHLFRFAVPDRPILRGLKVGQKLWADFATGKVTVDPIKGPCCRILSGKARDSTGTQPVDTALQRPQ